MKDKKSIVVVAIIIILIAVITVVGIVIFKKVNTKPIQASNNIEENQNITTEDNQKDEEEYKSTIEDDIIKEELGELNQKGVITSKRSKYTDAKGNVAIIPDGYAVVTDATDISNGLVISDVADDDLNNSKKGNQFVWVPVKLPAIDVGGCKNEEEINELISLYTDKEKYPMAIKLKDGNYKSVLYEFKSKNFGSAVDIVFQNYRENEGSISEPQNLKDTNESENVDNWTDKLYQNEYNEMIKKVITDKGFWIARFETSKGEDNTAKSVKNVDVISEINWYDTYRLEKTYSAGTTKGHMIWGTQWDQTMIWLMDIENPDGTDNRYYILDSTNMGNYLDLMVKDDAKNVIIKPEGVAYKYYSGEYEKSKTKNIYDLAGNMFEWTMESNLNSTRITRGGYCAYNGKMYPAAARYYIAVPTIVHTAFGSRMTLY